MRLSFRPVTFLIAAIAGLLVSGGATASDAAAQFELGLQAFDEAAEYGESHPSDALGLRKRYAKAANHFVTAWEIGALTTSVLLNAANSFGFAESLGQAVLFYKRALALDPGHENARQGLEHLRSRMPIRAAGRDQVSLADSLFFWHREQNFSLRKNAFLVIFPLAWIFFLLEIALRKRSSWVGPFAVAGYLSLAISTAMLTSLLYETSTRDPQAAAVVVVEVRGRTGPGEQYQPSHKRIGMEDEALIFPPGTEVQIVDDSRDAWSEKDWFEAELLDGSRTFLPTATVERVFREGS